MSKRTVVIVVTRARRAGEWDDEFREWNVPEESIRDPSFVFRLTDVPDKLILIRGQPEESSVADDIKEQLDIQGISVEDANVAIFIHQDGSDCEKINVGEGLVTPIGYSLRDTAKSAVHAFLNACESSEEIDTYLCHEIEWKCVNELQLFEIYIPELQDLLLTLRLHVELAARPNKDSHQSAVQETMLAIESIVKQERFSSKKYVDAVTPLTYVWDDSTSGCTKR